MLRTPRAFNQEQLVAMLSYANVFIAQDGIHCPDCGGTLELTEATTMVPYVAGGLAGGFHTAGTPLPMKEKETIIAACWSCEFILDLGEAVR